MGPQCVSCHKDIGWLADRNRGYHGGATVKGTPCASCHPDHAGQGIRHGAVARGQRRAVRSRPGGMAPQAEARRGQVRRRATWRSTRSHRRRSSPPARPGQGYTGLGTTCTSCHEDVHRAALGQDCTAVPRRRQLDRDARLRSRHDGVSAPGQARRGEVQRLPPRCPARAEARRQGPAGAGVQAGVVLDVPGLPRGSALGRTRSQVRGLPHDGGIPGDRQEAVRPRPDQVPAPGTARGRQLCGVSPGLLDAGGEEAGLRDLHELPPGRAQRHRHAGGQAGRLRLLPHRGRVHALDATPWRATRRRSIPLEGKHAAVQVRRLPHPERHGDRGDAIRQRRRW